MAVVYNLTPHAIHVYADDGKRMLAEYASHGELRLATLPQADDVPLVTADGAQLPVVRHQVFTSLDPSSRGYVLFTQKRTDAHAAFIVSAVVAEWLCKQLLPVPPPLLFAPSTNPAFGVRDAAGKIIGTKRLEHFA